MSYILLFDCNHEFKSWRLKCQWCTHTVTISSPFLRHQWHLCGCRWWWCDLYDLWVLRDEGGFWVCLVQELPDYDRHLSHDYYHWKGQVSILYVPNFSCSVQGPNLLPCSCSSSSSFLITCRPHVSSSPDPEPSSTVPPWRIWAPSPAWSPTLTASPPATRSLRRVSQPTQSWHLRSRNLIHLLFVWVTLVLKVFGGLEGASLLSCFNSCIKMTSVALWCLCLFVWKVVSNYSVSICQSYSQI